MASLAFFGPRTFAPQDLPSLAAVIEALPSSTLVWSGGAQGFDFAAAHLAVQRGLAVRLLVPTPHYLEYYYRGKGHDPKLIGQTRSMDALLSSPKVTVQFVAPPFTKGSNFLRNTALAQRTRAAVTPSSQPTTTGTTHALSEFVRLNREVTFLTQ